jgi:hypothetical protein
LYISTQFLFFAKLQLFSEYFVNFYFFRVDCIFHRALARLQITTRRLGAAAVSSESYAAHNCSNFHSQFMRASAAVVPNLW